MTNPNPLSRSPWFLLLGFLLLGSGLVAAWRWQPEWQVDELPSRSDFAGRYESLAEQMAFDLPGGPERVELRSIAHIAALDRAQGAEFFDFLRTVTGGLEIAVVGPAIDEEGRRGKLEVIFDPEIRPTSITWEVFNAGVFFNPTGMKDWPAIERVQQALLRPGERLGEVIAGEDGAAVFYGADLEGSERPQYLTWGLGPSVQFFRMHGEVDAYRDNLIQRRLSQVLLFFARRAFFLIVTGLILVFLLVRRRVDLVNGVFLSMLATFTFLLTGLARTIGIGGWIPIVFFATCWGPWLLFLWSVGESWVRTSNEQRSEAIDALRVGRLGPHVGRAIAYGLIGGAALAGLRLLATTIAGALPGIVTLSSSVALPLANASRNPIVLGIFLASLAIFGLGFALNFMPARWRRVLAVPAIALVGLEVAPIQPWPAALLLTTAFGLVFVAVFRRGGILGLLLAGLTSTLWPLLALSLRSPEWLLGTALITGLPLVGLTAASLIGLRRSDEVDEPRRHQPAFLRRLDKQRRVGYEMGLLARMQSALLPSEIPRLDGWDLAATSMFANEVGGDLYDFTSDDEGRLWIAAGDVAGHGYSCAIGHAMTKAALAATIDYRRQPSEVLSEVDRVLRTLNSDRWFTALALVRLDLESGQALIANAGYPYPLLVKGGDAAEVELPGLPLGQGPARVYRDHQIVVEPGATLVLYSDGLCEALDSSGETTYGFDRPAQVMAGGTTSGDLGMRRPSIRSATLVLDRLMADWRAHCGGVEPGDDTTVIVVHRSGDSA